MNCFGTILNSRAVAESTEHMHMWHSVMKTGNLNPYTDKMYLFSSSTPMFAAYHAATTNALRVECDAVDTPMARDCEQMLRANQDRSLSRDAALSRARAARSDPGAARGPRGRRVID